MSPRDLFSGIIHSYFPEPPLMDLRELLISETAPDLRDQLKLFYSYVDSTKDRYGDKRNRKRFNAVHEISKNWEYIYYAQNGDTV